ncbi:MAG: DNA-binding protein [Candidatus Gracilibacteria bacterium]|nr:DNA-binding protein [Candidatus Gracilibacteria bacterium]MDD5178757.1 DNA-binding protein [Candidatus Gracilibacteria bacterium]
MQSKRFGNKIVIRIDKGEEIVEILKKVCEENQIKLGVVSGIGATNQATIGLFETAEKKYHSTELKGDFEIAPLMGNISTLDGKLYLHLHANLADNKHHCFGGHLDFAIVSATAECVIDIIDGEVNRKFSEEIGLNLLD